MYVLNRERGPWQTEADSGVRGPGGVLRPLVVVVEPRGCRLRPKGCRSGEFFITWGTVYLRGAAANAGFDTAATGKGSTKRRATIELVQQLYEALALLTPLAPDRIAKDRGDSALVAAEKSGLVKVCFRRAAQAVQDIIDAKGAAQ